MDYCCIDHHQVLFVHHSRNMIWRFLSVRFITHFRLRGNTWCRLTGFALNAASDFQKLVILASMFLVSEQRQGSCCSLRWNKQTAIFSSPYGHGSLLAIQKEDMTLLELSFAEPGACACGRSCFFLDRDLLDIVQLTTGVFTQS